MIERDIPLPGVGGSFRAENALFQAVFQDETANEGRNGSTVNDLLLELESDNPFIGQEVVITTNEPMSLITGQEGVAGSVVAGEMICKVEGFYAEVSSQTSSASLGVRLGFSGNNEESTLIGMIPAESITDIELVETANPFAVEQQQFNDVWLQIPALRRRYPEAQPDDILDWFIDQKLNCTSLQRHAHVELLICHESPAKFIYKANPPEWLIDDEEIILNSIRDEDESEDEDDDFEYAGIKGKLHGKVEDFSYKYDDEDEPPMLEVAIEISPLDELSQQGKVRYIVVQVNDISTGKIVGGPLLN